MAYLVATDLSPVGEFHSSNELINKLQAACVRTIAANQMGMPTDCPQRCADLSGFMSTFKSCVVPILFANLKLTVGKGNGAAGPATLKYLQIPSPGTSTLPAIGLNTLTRFLTTRQSTQATTPTAVVRVFLVGSPASFQTMATTVVAIATRSGRQYCRACGTTCWHIMTIGPRLAATSSA